MKRKRHQNPEEERSKRERPIIISNASSEERGLGGKSPKKRINRQQ